MTFRKRAALIPLALMMAVSLARAATLSGIQGGVMINAGQGYRAVAQETLLKEGDMVMVQPGASAQVVYADGCQVPVQVGAVHVIHAQSPCALAKQQPFPGKAWVESTGVVEIAAGLAGVGAVAGAAVMVGGDKSKPASP